MNIFYFIYILGINKMPDSKFVLTLAGLLALVFAICKVDATPKSKEGFWGVSVPRTVTMETVRNRGGVVTSMPQNYGLGSPASTSFISTPNFQGQLSPRFDGQQLSSNITYNAPGERYMAAPSYPLKTGCSTTTSYEGFVENYGCSRGCKDSCNCPATKFGCGSMPGSNGHGTAPMPGGNGHGLSPNESRVNGLKKLRGDSISTGSTVPVGNLLSEMDASGEEVPTVFYQRYRFANANSRLRAHGDPIRGDLAIQPDCSNNGWFKVSVDPSTALQGGAMNVMGGNNNETSNELAKLQYLSTGGQSTTFAGVDLSNSFVSDLGTQFAGLDVRTFA
jgi:hypothetical protein